MTNEKIDAIMCDYVDKASKFCNSYVEEVLGKHYSSYSNTIATIYANFESELWRLKHEAETALNEEIEALVNKGENVDEVFKLGKLCEDDLWTMHKYYKYFFSGKIANGLAKSWIKAGNDAIWELTTRSIKRSMGKGGKL